MRVFVTGVAGLLGSDTVKGLVRRIHKPILSDVREPAYDPTTPEPLTGENPDPFFEPLGCVSKFDPAA